MKPSLRIFGLSAFAMCLLTVFALADSGPKDLLTVRVEHPPEEGYYLDLVAEGEYEGHTYGSGDSEYSGIDWSYSDEEAAALDAELLDALRAAVPEGSHACTAEGTNGAPMWGDLEGEDSLSGARLHTFSYFGVPDTYQILIVTKDGDSYLSPPCTRQVLQSSVTVDWADKSVVVPSVWASYVLQFLCTALTTLVIEGGLLLYFGFGKTKRNRLVFLLVNLVTQGGLAVYTAHLFLRHGVSGWSVLFGLIPAELVITAVEVLLYRYLLTGQTRARATAYGVLANLCSAALGIFLAEPVWQLMISIL